MGQTNDETKQRKEREREREMWQWSNMLMMTSLKAPRATAPMCSWSPAPGRPLPVLTVAPQRTSHLHYFPPFPLHLLLPHQHGNSRKAELKKYIRFHWDNRSGPKTSAVTHLCHNVGICHIKMICIKFTEFWTKSGNYFTRNKIWSMTEQHFWHLEWTYQWEHTINLFSVRAVRLKCRMSWWRGSGFVSFSSSSSPSSCSIAF